MEVIDPQSSETVGYHLFLEPEGQLLSDLMSINAGIGLRYHAPLFRPHVTVLARIIASSDEEVCAKAMAFASDLSPITITLGSLTSRNRYFMALYSHIEEQEELLAVHRAAAAAFGMSSDQSYEAHLSLLYGNHDKALKEEIRMKTVLRQPASFTARALHVYRTPGSVERWEKIATFPFGES